MAENSESNYITALSNFRDGLRIALEIADDPFKAPEETVEQSQFLLPLIWRVQVEYSAMTLLARRKKEGNA